MTGGAQLAEEIGSTDGAWQHRPGLRAHLRRFVRRHAFFNWALTPFRPKYRQFAVRRDTQLVIEGYPRCANTFAYVALQMCQPQPVRIAHHLHSLGQVKRAVRLAIPTLVLTRQPKCAVLSLAIRRGIADVESPLIEYAEYYEGVAELGDSVLVADFQEVIDDYGSVIRRVNHRFGTSFVEFEHTPEQLEEAYRLVDEQEIAQTGADQMRSTHVARPTVDREQLKTKLLPLLEQARVQRLLQSAENAYARVLRSNATREWDGEQ